MPDLLIIDPLINVMGGANANDNATAALLMGQLAALAATRQISIALARHVSKGRDVTSAESAMGAASFVNLARIALAIESLNEKDGDHWATSMGSMAYLSVLYDVPRNKSALRQVFGRFDRLGRIGQLTIHVLVPEGAPDATDFEPVRLLHEIDLEQQE